MSINRRMNLMISTVMVFVFLTLILCWGSGGVNNVNRSNKAAIEQLKGG